MTDDIKKEIAKNDWRERLQAGDKVIVCRGRGNEKIETVAKTTKLYIYINGYLRFRKRDGFEPGYSLYNGAYINEATPERIKQVEEDCAHKDIVKTISNTQFNKLSLEYLKKIKSVIDNARQNV